MINRTPAVAAMRIVRVPDLRPRPPRRTSVAVTALAALLASGCSALPAEAERSARFGKAPPSQSPKRKVEFTITPQVEAGGMTGLRVDMRFAGDSDGETTLVLPDNPDLPGVKYREGVRELSVSGASLADAGSAEPVLVHRPNAPIELSYRIVETSPDMPFATQIEPNYFAAVGEAVFARIEGSEASANIRWGALPPAWTINSDLKHPFKQNGLSWDEVRESTIIGGRGLAVVERKVGKGRLRMVMPPGASLDMQAFADMAARIAKEAQALWEDPGGEYLITLATVDFRGQAGLGRGSGYALYLPREPDWQELPHSLAHEYLHTWIGRRFGGGNAWFREGFTEFYTRQIGLRAGTSTVDRFLKRWNDVLLRYGRSRFRTLPDAETNVRFFADEEAQRLGEDRGSMLAALFDHRIRKASAGKYNLASIMLEVKREVDRKRGGGDGPERLVKAARRLASVDLLPDMDRYLRRAELLTFPPDLFGPCVSVEAISLPNIELGFPQPKRGEAITGLPKDGPAYAAGLRDGMVLLGTKLGLTPGTSQNAGSADVEYRVRDGGEERTIRFKPALGIPTTVQSLELKKGLDAAAAAECARGLSGLA